MRTRKINPGFMRRSMIADDYIGTGKDDRQAGICDRYHGQPAAWGIRKKGGDAWLVACSAHRFIGITPARQITWRLSDSPAPQILYQIERATPR
jgi:hypothetical protein